MKKPVLLAILLVGWAMNIVAQDINFKGYITDAANNKGLAYVHMIVEFMNGPDKGKAITFITDESGSFSVNLKPAPAYQVSVSHLGHLAEKLVISKHEIEKGDYNISLDRTMIPLGEVDVSCLRYEQTEKEVALPIVVIHRSDIIKQTAMTLSDVLSREPGLALYRDGAWGTSVNIRGLGENRLVVLIDGNRIETASDLSAGLSMVDLQEIDRIELIKGAASSIYGSGAMGGVVNIVSKRADYSKGFQVHGEALGIFEGVNSLYGSHVGINASSEKLRFRISGGFRNAESFKTPEGILENSGFKDRDINVNMAIKPFKNHELEILAQDYQALDVGIPGGAPFATSALATYPEERRQLISGSYSIKDLLPGLEKLTLRIFHQFILRDVDMQPNIPPVIANNQRITVERIRPKGKHNTTGGMIESFWILGAKQKIVAGIDIWQRQLETSREKYIRQEILDDFGMVKNTLQLIRGEKPNPDSRFGSAGLFVQHESRWMDGRVELNIGMRSDIIKVSNDESVDPVYLLVNGVAKEPVPGQRLIFNADQHTTPSWSSNISVLYHITNDVDLSVNAGRSFRSPSLEERFKYIDLGSKVRLGDPTLEPEKGLFGDLGVKIWKDHFHLQTNIFVHYLNNMIVETPGLFVFTMPNGIIGMTDTLPALINDNVEKALLYGGEFSIDFQFARNLVAFSRFSVIFGDNLCNGGYLSLIPPMNTSVGMRYQLPDFFSIEWTTRAYAPQRRIAVGENESEGYIITNLSMSSFPKQLGIAGFQLFMGVENLFNRSYKNHLATNRGLINLEPGRNVYVKLLMKF